MNQFEDDFAPNPTQSPTSQMSHLDRLRAMQESANQPVHCEQCGSEWFYEAELHQYRGGMYASAPGGDLQVISTMPQRIRVCLCGNPISPNLAGYRGGRQPNQAIDSFRRSLDIAQKHRAVVATLDRKVEALITQAATTKEIEDLIRRIDELKTEIVAKKPAPKEVAPVQEAAPQEVSQEETDHAEGETEKRRGRPRKMIDPYA